MTQPKGMGGLGFKDFELFNLAMLARQAWRVLVDDDSLSAQILKAAYYPNSSLLDATLGPHPSQIWRAIIDGRDVLAQGIIRRVGDGETTNISHHNWIPRPSFKRPITSLVPAPPEKVSELIDTTTASWKEGLVRAVFTPFDAEEILKIPLCTRRIDDFWAWNEEKRGTFSVCSAYRMIVRIKTESEG